MYVTKYLVTQPLDAERTLLVNTLSGAVDIIDRESLAALRDTGSLAARPQLAETLRQRGYLFDDPAAEQGLLEQLYRKYCSIERPKTFVICPTHACNLRCRYCFEGDVPATQTKVMTNADVDRVFQAIRTLDPATGGIQLFGGEPLLPTTYAAVGRILKKARKFGMRVSVVTNGTNIERFSGLLRDYRDVLAHFQITLDGPKDVHDQRRGYAGGQGSFEQVVEGVDAALELGVSVRVRINVDAHNIDALPALADYLIGKGWLDDERFEATLAPVTDHHGRTDMPHFLSEDQLAERIVEMRRSAERLDIFGFQLFRVLDHISRVIDGSDAPTVPRFHYCESNNLDCFAFGADGMIYACSEAIGHADMAVGRYQPVYELFEDRLAQWDNRGILTMSKCRDCRVATLCGGGCAYAAIAQNGSSAEPVCQGAEETLTAYLKQVGRKLLQNTVAPT